MALQNITQFFPNTLISDTGITHNLGEEFVLCENGNMVFHWADFFETCDMVKSRMESDPELMNDFKAREASLSKLNLIPVWIRTENKILQTTMYDLYERYILNQTKLMDGVDPSCPIEISFISGTGPFKGMTITECFNKATYRDFVLVNLLKGKLPRRDFRIRLKSKILVEFGKNFQETSLIALEQMTMNGLLLSMDSEIYKKKVLEGDSLRILINTQMLQDGAGKSLPELKVHLSQYAFNLLYSSRKEDAVTCDVKEFSAQSSFDFSQNKKVYLFISYSKLGGSQVSSVKVIQDFVTNTRNLVKDYYVQNGVKKTA